MNCSLRYANVEGVNRYLSMGFIALVLAGGFGAALYIQTSRFAHPITSNSHVSPPASGDGAIHYVVHDGDTLPSIAEFFGVSASAILQINHLSNVTLQTGQVLSIPPLAGVVYTIKSGDTLESIAQRFGESDAEIRAVNHIEDSSLKVGSEIIIPNTPSSYPDSR